MAGTIGWTLLLALLATPAAGHDATISGRVVNQRTKEPIAKALVILQCTCLRGARETMTNEDGLYAFKGLPAGTYTIQVLAGTADVSKVVTLPPTPRKPSAAP